jgi:hypothetical protein
MLRGKLGPGLGPTQQDSVARIMLVYSNPLFAHSIRAALSAAPQHTLIAEISDWSQAEAQMARLIPDTVIVEEGEAQATDAMLRALRAQPAPWRVIAMRLDETTMHIWSGAWEPLTRTQDLMDVLEATVARPPAAHLPPTRRKGTA